jgi:glycosyltransferase involved in cell wall biosynthesis
MKVAIIGSRGYPYVYSGYETFVKELSERLVKKNIRVTVYCHKGFFKNRPKILNSINLVYIPTIETKSLSQLVHSTLSIIHCCFSKVDVILVVNAANGPLGLITKIFKKPTLINVDGLEWLRPKWKGLGSLYFKLSARIATLLYDIIITDSKEMKEVYLKKFNKNSTVIAYGPIKKYDSKSNILSKLKLKSNNYFLIIGRLIPDNNADFILEEFLSSKTSKKLVIVGDVPYNDSYSKKIKSNNKKNILFTGYINNELELTDLYKNCYGYLHGHEFGGTNPTMINALKLCCFIIALDTPFNREMLSQNKYGIFFNKTKGSLKYIIESTKSSTRLKYIEQLKKDGLSEDYNWDKITDKYINQFKSLMDK